MWVLFLGRFPFDLPTRPHCWKSACKLCSAAVVQEEYNTPIKNIFQLPFSFLCWFRDKVTSLRRLVGHFSPAASLHSCVDAEWATEEFRGLFKCHILCFFLLLLPSLLPVRRALAGKNVVTSADPFLSHIPKSQRRILKDASSCHYFFVSLSVCSLVTLPQSSVAKKQAGRVD